MAQLDEDDAHKVRALMEAKFNTLTGIAHIQSDRLWKTTSDGPKVIWNPVPQPMGEKAGYDEED